jgi:hypothetical protein
LKEMKDVSEESFQSIINNIPVIENIHQAVHKAITADGNALDMSQWHTCETTHCRAGWVVHLAGHRGKLLESMTSTEYAAMMIYKASSEIKVAPTRFYGTNEVSMADIVRCAELEKEAAATNE